MEKNAVGILLTTLSIYNRYSREYYLRKKKNLPSTTDITNSSSHIYAR
jgi:hypothetical protein